MDKLQKDRGDYIRLSIDAKEYIESSKMMKAVKWNGREIRNGKLLCIYRLKRVAPTNTSSGFQTAVALAEHEADKDSEGKILVKETHLSSIVKMSREFQEYLTELHMADENKRAENDFSRLSSYPKGLSNARD
jgi:hypothetical protein